jgi:CDP-diacylglycerol--glycerol-3-phosphate 3-phosphatidyltransferase
MLRLCTIPVFVWLFLTSDGKTMVAGIVFAVAAWTDFFDGYIARRYSVLSRFGKFVDPLVDRLFVNTAAVLVAFSGKIFEGHGLGLPWWSFLAVMWRDLMGSIGFMVVRRKVFIPDVNRAGKWGTAGLMAGLAWIMILEGSVIFEWIFWIGFALSSVAFIEYFQQYKWVIGFGERPSQSKVATGLPDTPGESDDERAITLPPNEG